MKIVLQKYIAESGFCSRRRAEELIRQKKVKVNNEIAELGTRVSEKDEVVIEGKEIKLIKKKIYIILNKPAGYTCTNRKFKGEKNIFELVDVKERLYTVGRLDKNSHGLVLLTNDGDLTEQLTHPRFEHEKEYLVKLKVKSEKFKVEEIIKSFRKGVDIGENEIGKAKNVEYLGDDKFRIILTEGKKRQIKRMFGALNLEVADLKRIRISSVKLGNLKRGKWIYLEKNEIV
ncbi:pseudouridine synthase [Candidatus Falkowbacteria bacterium]|nr:MAG: pseudouridine synthase [Candidatus Falkowbacteria bacterium]